MPVCVQCFSLAIQLVDIQNRAGDDLGKRFAKVIATWVQGKSIS